MNNIIEIILTRLIQFILSIILTFLYRKFINKSIKYCYFRPPGTNYPKESKQVEVSKRFGRVVNVNCPYFNMREEKIHNGQKFLYCPYGKTINPNSIDNRGGPCRFV